MEKELSIGMAGLRSSVYAIHEAVSKLTTTTILSTEVGFCFSPIYTLPLGANHKD